MEGMRKVNFGIYMSLLITFLKVTNEIGPDLCIKGLIVVVIAVIGGNAVEHAKSLMGAFQFKKDKSKLP